MKTYLWKNVVEFAQVQSSNQNLSHIPGVFELLSQSAVGFKGKKDHVPISRL